MNPTLLFAAGLLLWGCGSTEGAAPSDPPPPVSASTGTSPDPCGDTRSATLSQVKEDVFPSCLSSSCHGGGGRAGDLDSCDRPLSRARWRLARPEGRGGARLDGASRCLPRGTR